MSPGKRTAAGRPDRGDDEGHEAKTCSEAGSGGGCDQVPEGPPADGSQGVKRQRGPSLTGDAAERLEWLGLGKSDAEEGSSESGMGGLSVLATAVHGPLSHPPASPFEDDFFRHGGGGLGLGPASSLHGPADFLRDLDLGDMFVCGGSGSGIGGGGGVQGDGVGAVSGFSAYASGLPPLPTYGLVPSLREPGADSPLSGYGWSDTSALSFMPPPLGLGPSAVPAPPSPASASYIGSPNGAASSSLRLGGGGGPIVPPARLMAGSPYLSNKRVPRARGRRVSFATTTKAHDGLLTHTAVYDALVFRSCSGGALTCPADVARLVELTDPSASPLEVLSIMRTVQGRVDDLLQRLRQVQARVLRPLRAQRRRYPFAPAACGGLGEGEGEGFVDVVGMGSPGREQQQQQMQQLQEQQRQQDTGAGSSADSAIAALSTPIPAPAPPAPAASQGPCSPEDSTCSEGSEEGEADLPLQVPVLPEGGGSCARLSTAAIPFVGALLSLLTSSVTASEAVVQSLSAGVAGIPRESSSPRTVTSVPTDTTPMRECVGVVGCGRGDSPDVVASAPISGV